jgi:hypothetical protein
MNLEMAGNCAAADGSALIADFVRKSWPIAAIDGLPERQKFGSRTF